MGHSSLGIAEVSFGTMLIHRNENKQSQIYDSGRCIKRDIKKCLLWQDSSIGKCEPTCGVISPHQYLNTLQDHNLEPVEQWAFNLFWYVNSNCFDM